MFESPAPFVSMGPDAEDGSPLWVERAKAEIARLTEALLSTDKELALKTKKLAEAEQALSGVRAYLNHRKDQLLTGPKPGEMVVILPAGKVKGRVLEAILMESGRTEYLVHYWYGGGPVTARLRHDQIEDENLLPPPEKP